MISSAYNYYMSMYGNRNFSRYDSHKRSDLKSTYNKMVSINRNSPLYKVDTSEKSQRLAIDIKETAREISNLANELTDAASGRYVADKKALSDNPDTVAAEYIGNKDANTEEFSVEVVKTAGNQVNTGHFMPPESRYLNTGAYSFDLSIDELIYEFQFNVGSNDTTGSIQRKISRLINNSNIGVNANILTNFGGDTALEIYSTATGDHKGEPIFTISDNSSSHASGSVELLGINRISQMPDNAIYKINGRQYESLSDSVLYNKEYKLTFKQPGTANISLGADTSSLSNSLSSLIESYNKTIALSADITGKPNGHGRLYNEFTRLAHAYSDVLNKNGLKLESDGRINVDAQQLANFSTNGTIHDTLKELDSFKENLKSKADSVYINPMEYVNRKIIAYKNPRNNFPNPYSDSAYAGMIFDGFY